MGGRSPARGNAVSEHTVYLPRRKPASQLEVTKQSEEALPEMGTEHRFGFGNRTGKVAYQGDV